jgi:hypothetical protein
MCKELQHRQRTYIILCEQVAQVKQTNVPVICQLNNHAPLQLLAQQQQPQHGTH